MVPDHKGLAITAPFRLNTRRSITSLQIARMLQIWTERKHILPNSGHPLAGDRFRRIFSPQEPRPLVSQNLLRDRHQGFVDTTGSADTTLIKRSAYAKVEWRF
jgi:hypothetical protein